MTSAPLSLKAPICSSPHSSPTNIVIFRLGTVQIVAVIRGATTHYDYVCNEVAKGIAHVSLDSGVPVMFGVVTTENIEQAIERAGTKAGNKGFDCAMGAIEMINLLESM